MEMAVPSLHGVPKLGKAAEKSSRKTDASVREIR